MNHKNPASGRYAQGNPTVLFPTVRVIEHRQGTRITKDRCSLLETDTMLALVQTSLVRIPFEIIGHGYSPSAIQSVNFKTPYTSGPSVVLRAGVPATEPVRPTGFPSPTGKRPQHTSSDARRQRRTSKKSPRRQFRAGSARRGRIGLEKSRQTRLRRMGRVRLRVCASSNGSHDDVRVDASAFSTAMSFHTSRSVESVQQRFSRAGVACEYGKSRPLRTRVRRRE